MRFAPLALLLIGLMGNAVQAAPNALAKGDVLPKASTTSVTAAAQADQIEADWGDTGVMRLLAHTLVGGLTGGAAGAAGAATGTLTAPAVANALTAAGIDGALNESLTAIASTLVGGATGGTAGAAAAYNEVTHNYLQHAEVLKLGQLKVARLRGRCDDACERDIHALETLDQERNDALSACSGVSSGACDNIRQQVRTAAAEYIRADADQLEIRYALEKQETVDLARGTTQGVAVGAVQGAARSVQASASSLVSAAKTAWAAITGDDQAREDIMRGAGAMADFVANPDNWSTLLGAMSPQEREALASAYERGDGKAIGELMGAQALDLLGNTPVTGGAGIIKKVEKASDAAQAAIKAPDGKSPVDIAHVIGADYNPSTGRVTGGHTLLKGDVRVLKIVSEPDANGVYEAIVEMRTPDGDWQIKTAGASNKPQKNTMFPKDWDAQRVQAEIEHAWLSPDREVNGIKWSGTSKSGVRIEGYVHPRITAYPVQRGKQP